MSKRTFWQEVTDFHPTDAIVNFRFTTAERDALVGVEDGESIYNTTTHEVQTYNNGQWVVLGIPISKVATVAALSALGSRPSLVYVVSTASGDDAEVPNDGGGGWYIWVAGSTVPENGTSVVSPFGEPLGRYISANWMPNRLSTTDRDAIGSPTEGMLVYNTTTHKFDVRVPAGWNSMATLDSGGKLNTDQIPDSLLGALQFQGTWNATTNSPTLTSSAGTAGNYYIVSVAGTTALNGISSWAVGDWAVYNGSVWSVVRGGVTAGEIAAALGYTPANVAGLLSQFATTSSTALRGIISDPTGTGSLVYGTAPTLSGLVTFGTGADNSVLIGVNSGATSYNVITLNGDHSDGGFTGLMGGATGLTRLILQSASDSIRFRIGGIEQGWFNSGVFVLGTEGDLGLSRVVPGVLGIGTGGVGAIDGGIRAGTLALGGASISGDVLAVIGSTSLSATTLNGNLNLNSHSLIMADSSSEIVDFSNGLISLRTSGGSSGVIVDVSTDAVLRVRNRANSADGSLIANKIALGGASLTSDALVIAGAQSWTGSISQVSGGIVGPGSGTITNYSGYAGTSGATFSWASRSQISSPTDGQILFQNAAGNNFSQFLLGGITSSFPSLKRNGAGISIRFADDSADTDLTAASLVLSGTALARTYGGTGSATISGGFDAEFSSTQGSILYRNATGWVALGPGSAGNFLRSGGAGANLSWAGEIGTVSSVSVTTANGVSGIVASATTTPAITFTLGAITPTTVNGNTITSGSGTLTLGASKVFTVSNSMTLTSNDGATLAIGAGGTLGSNAYTSTAYAPLASPTFSGTVIAPILTLGVQQSAQGSLVLANTAAAAYAATLKSSNSATVATTLILPPDAGTGGFYLMTDGSGNLSWTNGIVNGVTVGATPVASGTDKRILYNNAGTLGLYSVSGSSSTVALIDVATLSSLTSIGTIGTGVWQGSIIASAYGGTGNGFTKFSGPAVSEKTFTLPNASDTILTAGATATISKGFTAAPFNLGNITNFTIDITQGNYQYGTNHAAATWTAPTADGSTTILVTNDGSAGTITFSGFTVGSNTGDTLDTTNGHKFLISILRINGTATYSVTALQ